MPAALLHLLKVRRKKVLQGTEFGWDIFDSPGFSIELKASTGLSSAYADFAPFTPPSKDDEQASQPRITLSIAFLFAPAFTLSKIRFTSMKPTQDPQRTQRRQHKAATNLCLHSGCLEHAHLPVPLRGNPIVGSFILPERFIPFVIIVRLAYMMLA